MAYAMFTHQKISLTNRIFLLQQQLNNIMDQKQKLLNFSANIADGVVTVEEMASDPTNIKNYGDFVQSYLAWKQKPDAEGGCANSLATIGGLNTSTDEATIAALAEVLETSVSTEYARAYQKKLDAIENQFDMQQQRIQTKLSAAEKQLEQVEQAEAKAIDRATPKYDGVG